jgi:hypothetical protein
MKRTVNHTGKRKIDFSSFTVTSQIRGVQKELEVSWDLTGLGFDSSNEVIVEVDTLGSNMRYVAGTVGSPEKSSLIPISNDLTELTAKVTLLTVDTSGGLRKITGKSASLAIIFQKAAQVQHGLLRVQLVDDLRTLWKVDYFTRVPVLQISNLNGSYSKLSSRKVFLNAILPEVIKEIALTCLMDFGDIDGDTRDSWLAFLKPYGLDDIKLSDFEDWDAGDLQGKIQEAITTSTSIAEEFSARNELVVRAIAELEASND